MFWVVGNVVYFLISLHRTSTQIGFVHNSLARTNPTRTFIENFGWNDHTRCLGGSGVVADRISKRRHCRQLCGRLAWILSDYNCTLNTSLGPFHGTRSSTLCGITRWIRGARLYHGLPSLVGTNHFMPSCFRSRLLSIMLGEPLVPELHTSMKDVEIAFSSRDLGAFVHRCIKIYLQTIPLRHLNLLWFLKII